MTKTDRTTDALVEALKVEIKRALARTALGSPVWHALSGVLDTIDRLRAAAGTPEGEPASLQQARDRILTAADDLERIEKQATTNAIVQHARNGHQMLRGALDLLRLPEAQPTPATDARTPERERLVNDLRTHVRWMRHQHWDVDMGPAVRLIDDAIAALSADPPAPRPDLEAACREALTYDVRRAADDAWDIAHEESRSPVEAWQDAILDAIRPALVGGEATPADAPPAPPKCATGHEWSNQYGEDWTPDVGTPCDCGARRWRADAPPAPEPDATPDEGTALKDLVAAIETALPVMVDRAKRGILDGCATRAVARRRQEPHKDAEFNHHGAGVDDGRRVGTPRSGATLAASTGHGVPVSRWGHGAAYRSGGRTARNDARRSERQHGRCARIPMADDTPLTDEALATKNAKACHADVLTAVIHRHGYVYGVELGAGLGALARALLEACPDLALVSVEARADRVRGLRYLEQRFDGRYRVVHATTETAVVDTGRDGVDFVFVDADHHYEAVKGDIARWRSKVRPGGWFGGHDYHPRFGGVIKAVNEAFATADDLYESGVDVLPCWVWSARRRA